MRHFHAQYCDKKILPLRAYLGCSIENYCLKKISFYRNIAILRAKRSRVNKALRGEVCENLSSAFFSDKMEEKKGGEREEYFPVSHHLFLSNLKHLF